MSKSGNISSKVDYTLLERKRVIDFLEKIKSAGDITIEEMEQKMEVLMSMGEHVQDVLLSILRTCDDEILPIVTFGLEYMDDPELIDPLIEILIDHSVREEIKLRILSILGNYGVDTSDPEFAEILESAFEDFEGVMHRSTLDMLDSIQQDDEAIAFLLENFHQFPPEAQVEMVRQFGDTKDERAVKILEIFAEVDDKVVAQEAIKYLGKIESPKSYAALEQIIADNDDAEITKLAEKSMRILQLANVKPMPTEQRVSMLGDIYKVIMSFIDGKGSRVLWIARWIENSKLETLNLMLNTRVGIKDCYGASNMSKRQFDKMVRTMRTEIDGVELDYNYALKLIKDAMYQNRESASAIPIEFVLWKRILKGDDISPARYVPKWDNFVDNLEALKNDEDILEESYHLHDLEDFSSWFDQSPKTYDYWDELEKLVNSYRGKTLDRKIDDLLKRYAVEVFEPQRDFIKRNLELTADFLFHQPNRRDEAELALVAALNLELKSTLPLHEHPFIERMMDESLEMAELNMSHGFDVRVNPEFFD